MINTPTPTKDHIRQLIDAHRDMVMERVNGFYVCSLLTFMFRPLPGGPAAQHRAMIYEIERCYYKMSTRVDRRPEKVPNYYKPFWIGCADWPVHKSGFKRDHFRNIALNDGLHFHMLALLPPANRLKEATIAQHIENHQDLYYPAGGRIDRIHTQETRFAADGSAVEDRNFDGADIMRSDIVGYVAKSVTRRRLDVGDMLILPRGRSEMSTLSKAERAYEREQRLIGCGRQCLPEPHKASEAVSERFAQPRPQRAGRTKS